jgi:hypothetical protein
MQSRPAGHVAFSVLFAGLVGTACGEEMQSDPRELWSAEDVVAERTFLPAEMDSLWSIGGTAADTLLLNPYWLSAGAEGVTLWDGGRNAVTRISAEGEILWTFGRQGGGPGEFRTVRGIAQLPGGGAAVVDNVNERLTIIDRDGRLAGETNLSGMAPESVASQDDGSLVVLTHLAEPAFLVSDRNGTIVDSVDFPSRPYRDLSPMARQGRVIGAGAEWVFGFTVGNGWWRIGGERAAEGFPYAEHADFPGIATTVREAVVDGRVATVRSTRTVETVFTARGFGVRGDTLFVHYYGETEYRGHLLDLFSLAEGSYLGSVFLPEGARLMAMGTDAIYMLRSDPFPVLTAYRMTVGEGAAR